LQMKTKVSVRRKHLPFSCSSKILRWCDNLWASSTSDPSYSWARQTENLHKVTFKENNEDNKIEKLTKICKFFLLSFKLQL
jgi:hypothetical protein